MRFIFCIFLFVTNFSSMTFARDNYIQDTLDFIFRHAKSSIKFIEEEKVFFHPDKVCLYQGKIFVESEEGEAIPIPFLCSNEDGLFLEINNGIVGNPPYNSWICTKCTKEYRGDQPPSFCKRCQNRNFILRYRWYPGSPGSGDVTGMGDRAE